MKRLFKGAGSFVILIALLFTVPQISNISFVDFISGLDNVVKETTKTIRVYDESLLDLEFDGEHQIVEINDNQATFDEKDMSLDNGGWQKFSDLDKLNRVGTADAMLHKSMMPTEEREPLYVDPTGWKNKEIKIDGKQKWLYNRSHLIGYQFTGENNNLKNLMTGTSSLNTPYMLEYENMVAKYIKDTNNHVRYQVEPVFKDDELVARGVHMQAKSVEDDGLDFNIYIFNVESGVKINYKDGSSKIER